MLHLRRNGSGPPVLFVHGVGGSGLLFQPVIQRMGGHYDLLRPDLLGYGHSPKPPDSPYDCTAHVEALRATVTAAGIGGPLVVVGLSMGGLLAVEYAARYPDEVRGLVLCGLPYYRAEAEARADLRHNLWTGLSLRVPRLARLLITPIWALGRRSRRLSRLLAPRMYAGEAARESMMATYQSFATSLRACLVSHRVEPGLQRIGASIPVRFIHGGADRWCPASRLAPLVDGHPRRDLRVLDGVGHNVVVLAPAAAAELVVDFLGALDP